MIRNRDSNIQEESYFMTIILNIKSFEIVASGLVILFLSSI